MSDTSGWRYLQGLFSRKLVLWASFIALLWLLRDFFALFLFSFVLSYLASTVVERLGEYVPYRKLLVCVVFILFIAILSALCVLIIPRVVQEVRNLIDGVNQGRMVERSTEAVESFLNRVGERFELKPVEESIREYLPSVTKSVLGTMTKMFTGLVTPVLYFLLALVLSFFLVLDLPNIAQRIHSLEHSRLQDFYQDVYPGVIAFFSLMGRALEAQTVVALVNTSLTAVGLALLDVPNIAMLSVIVFVASYIPVLGMWLSTIPMSIVAVAKGGLILGVKVVGMVAVVHSVEAYIINPRIYGAHMEVHPLMVLIILIVGEHVAGLWGLILGVPIWTYVYRYAILGQTDELWASAAAAPLEMGVPEGRQEVGPEERPSETASSRL